LLVSVSLLLVSKSDLLVSILLLRVSKSDFLVADGLRAIALAPRAALSQRERAPFQFVDLTTA